MPKIAMIGAGSLVFCKTLSMDILSTPALQGSEICLMSRTRTKLARMEAFLKRVVKTNSLNATVWSTLDRREALQDADYVINMVQVGGVDAFQIDYEVPLKYGVDQCIADSLGPGGVFRTLRTAPLLAEMMSDMEELCPDALLINYANPMAACCLALGRVMENGRAASSAARASSRWRFARTDRLAATSTPWRRTAMTFAPGNRSSQTGRVIVLRGSLKPHGNGRPSMLRCRSAFAWPR